MIPYYSPNLSLKKIFSALISKNKSNVVAEYFKKLTGKKYILLTNSARSALYLSYNAIGVKGEIITSPLTCRSALDPILYSGNEPFFIDIKIDTLNVNENLLYNLKQIELENIKAIQVIHHGGLMCEMDKILKFAKENLLFVIEDCAQSFGATYKGNQSGSFGDIACFSLIKNAYGIGGGILATNDYDIYKNAKSQQNNLPKISISKILIRVIRAFIETYRSYYLVNLFYNVLMKFKNERKSNNSFKKELKTPRNIIFNFFYSQLNDLPRLHKKRKKNALILLDVLKKADIIKNYLSINRINESSFTKFFVFNPKFNSEKTIKKLNSYGIEAMHLEHSYKFYYQLKLDKSTMYKNFHSLYNCKNYLYVQDKIVSIPLLEKKMDYENITAKLLK